MFHQIVYGSLLHPKELAKHHISLEDIAYVKVQHLRRIFNQEPTWRKINSIHRAVLNVEFEQDAWFNALLIKNLTVSHLEELDIRETGYERVNIPNGNVKLYNSGEIIKNCVLYKGKPEFQNNKLQPHKEYFSLCDEGAKSHFEEFYLDYRKTTFQNSLDGNIKLI